jgi:acyl-coenzyme A synthetase/AMP-(fatty) acid ligase
MPRYPLIAHSHPESVIAHRRTGPVTARRFLSHARALARRLPDGAAHVLNVCADRYLFAVGLAAALLARKISLMPPAQTPEVLRQLQLFAPDAVCLVDDPHFQCPLPSLHCGEPQDCAEPNAGDESGPWEVPQIDAAQSAAYIFTSGSTGVPVPHRKSWGNLVRCIRIENERLCLRDTPHALLATVPPQHMYGFESSVLLGLVGGHTLCAERPFFPADIAAALAATPAPRVLISTPVHLRALIAAGVELPAVAVVVSATAPLPQSLAREVEARCSAPLIEIYGSTETGQIAARRTTETMEWRLWRGATLTVEGAQCWIRGGHVEQPVVMSDVLEPLGEGRFLLHGRHADLVNIAGKRSSLAYLNHQLNAIPGVQDGVFYVREEGSASAGGVTRLGALVVAPSLDVHAVLGALRERIDPVFLPRPLSLVERLPRNATGKLPREALESVIARCLDAAAPESA